MKFKVGSRVYRSFSPQRAGVVTAVNGYPQIPKRDGGEFTSSFVDLTVKWLNGEVETVSEAALKDFDALIADHQKKLKTHLATLAKLEKLC